MTVLTKCIIAILAILGVAAVIHVMSTHPSIWVWGWFALFVLVVLSITFESLKEVDSNRSWFEDEDEDGVDVDEDEK